MKEIEIPLELKTPNSAIGEYTIPEGYEVEIKDGKVIVGKKEEPLTEFKDEILKAIADYVHIPKDKDNIVNIHELRDYVERTSKNLLAIARKELALEFPAMLRKAHESGKEEGHREGYDKGYDDGFKKAQEAQSFHYQCTPLPYVVPCYAPNGICTNPQMDCINCPKHRSGGDYVTKTNISEEK